MLTSKIWTDCGYRRPPGQVRARMMPEAPKDAIFGHANHVDIHELFDFDLSAAKSGRIKRITVVKAGYVHSGAFVIPTTESERRAAAERNLKSLLADLTVDYWNQFRRIQSDRAGRNSRIQRRNHRYTTNKQLQEPLSVDAIKRMWPDEVAAYETLKPLETAIRAVADEIAAI